MILWWRNGVKTNDNQKIARARNFRILCSMPIYSPVAVLHNSNHASCCSYAEIYWKCWRTMNVQRKNVGLAHAYSTSSLVVFVHSKQNVWQRFKVNNLYSLQSYWHNEIFFAGFKTIASSKPWPKSMASMRIRSSFWCGHANREAMPETTLPLIWSW